MYHAGHIQVSRFIKVVFALAQRQPFLEKKLYRAVIQLHYIQPLSAK